MFWIGLLSCWTVMSFILLLSDSQDWIAIWSLPCEIILCFPAFVILLPFYLAYAFLIRPWCNVWKPVEQERFDRVVRLGNSKFIRLLPRLYLCFERKAALANRVFFVRIKKPNGFNLWEEILKTPHLIINHGRSDTEDGEQ